MSVLPTPLLLSCLAACSAAYDQAEAEIEALDRAIGDGDHYINLKRGLGVALSKAPEWQSLPPDQVLSQIAQRLLGAIGGASGPLLASFLMAAAKVPGADAPDHATLARMVTAGVQAVMARGKAGRGEKTMLDVLIPISERLEALTAAGASPEQIARELPALADQEAEATAGMLATKGRASLLGDRVLGHVDPGARSMALLIRVICETALPPSAAAA